MAKGNEISESVMRFCQVCLNEYLGTRKGTGGKRTQQLVPELIALMLRNQRHEVYKYSWGKRGKNERRDKVEQKKEEESQPASQPASQPQVERLRGGRKDHVDSDNGRQGPHQHIGAEESTNTLTIAQL